MPDSTPLNVDLLALPADTPYAKVYQLLEQLGCPLHPPEGPTSMQGFLEGSPQYCALSWSAEQPVLVMGPAGLAPGQQKRGSQQRKLWSPTRMEHLRQAAEAWLFSFRINDSTNTHGFAYWHQQTLQRHYYIGERYMAANDGYFLPEEPAGISFLDSAFTLRLLENLLGPWDHLAGRSFQAFGIAQVN